MPTDILSFLLDPAVSERELEPLKQDVGTDVVNSLEDSSVVETNSAEKNEIVSKKHCVSRETLIPEAYSGGWRQSKRARGEP